MERQTLVYGRLRDECLNEHWFMSFPLAQTIVESRRDDYNWLGKPQSDSRNPWT